MHFSSPEASENRPPSRAQTVDSTTSMPTLRQTSQAVTPDEPPCATATVNYAQYYPREVFCESQDSTEPTVLEGGHLGDPLIRTDTLTGPRLLYKVSDMPSRVWTSTLMENWLNYVHPLMPIVPQRWLMPREGYTVPTILLKSVFLSGGRTSATFSPALCKEYYLSAKAMVHDQYEKNPIINIVAACLLGWYNQASPWAVTHDSSRYWLHFASNIVYQVGLHREVVGELQSSYKRKLWWTLVARDCLVACGHGRPRIFDLRYSNRPCISIEDFEPGDKHAATFVVYVRLCLIIGDLCEGYQQGRKQLARLGADVKHRLLSWLKDLPPHLRYFDATAQFRETADNFILRQVFAIYLATVTLLSKAEPRPVGSVSPVALRASSFLATLLEGFLARDEAARLPAMFTFYTLAAAIPQVAARKYKRLRPAIELDLQIFEDALTALSTKWPSAASRVTTLRALRAKKPCTCAAGEETPTLTDVEDRLLFKDFDTKACRLWTYIRDDRATTTRRAADEVAELASVTENEFSTETCARLEMLDYAFQGSPSSSSWEALPAQEISTGLSDDLGSQWPEDNFWNDPSLDFSDTLGSWLFADESFPDLGG
ncbi:uncharacterized protein PV06_08990 [Exophiala oligosperma]|uniref:Xylanolytic transcriptional activator regulatory domain-containing protein n=1 Tax=Exophiala oligosperma TaxID=215243 RepID=A0A0D2D9Q6_9EURO|nr:uncharacterized protein PV06_08990 [Exophiala oligosperma]KIW39195.1 hypothetical protein PV06_08990 [Exophiala oligosperma]